MEILGPINHGVLASLRAMREAHNKYAQLGVVNRWVQTYLINISEFLISNMTFHTPSPLGCHKGNHPTTPLRMSMSGYRDDQESTKSQIAFMRSGFFFIGFIISLALFMVSQARAENLTIATASNFAHTLKQVSGQFTKQTGHTINIIQGSSGALATQIIHGLPVDVFLSADQARIDKVIAAGIAISTSRFTYTTGQLTLWSTDKNLISKPASPADITALLTSAKISQISIANPKLAPYGQAAMQTLKSLNVTTALTGKIIHPQNIALTLTTITKGGVQLGFIARSQHQRAPYNATGSYWHVPENWHAQIRQDGVVLKTSKHLSLAFQFRAFLKPSIPLK